MQFRTLGKTDLEVSAICLGTMNWGEQNSEAEAHAQLDCAIAAGVNFIDTAELYPVPPRAETQGRTEAYLGNWLKTRRDRDRLVIATKVCGRADWIPQIRDGKARLDRPNIGTALDASLRRLQTDYVDLYQLHWPDRRSNYFGKLGYLPEDDSDATPLAETLAALADCVKAGKIRHVGVCNETPWGVMKLLAIAEAAGLPRIVSVQNPYNLLNRTFEIGLAEIAHREQVGLLAYSPLGFGVLSGKYLAGHRPEGARLTLFPDYKRYKTRESGPAIEKYVSLAQGAGMQPIQMALAYVNSRPFVTSTIIGATTMDQLKMNLASVNIALPKDIIKGIEKIHVQHPNPCP